MRRLLLIAALLVAGVGPAWAQSDARKLAVFWAGGANNEGTERTTGNDAVGSAGWYPSVNMHIALRCLEQMGVPYTVFLLPDSAGGWARVMGATRPAGVADSTWFRTNGYFGWMTAFSSGSNTKEMWNYFTDAGSKRGLQAGSPIDGWSIPGLVFTNSAVNVPGASYTNGINGTSSPAHPGSTSGAFTNGDSIAFGGAVVGKWHLSPASTADVTPIIYADSIEGATRLAYKAWVYRNTVLYYPNVTYSEPLSVVLGLADLFNRAGYTPARKLNMHMTIDHIFPGSNTSNHRTAPSDSFFKYVEANNWRLSGAAKPHATERSDVLASVSAGWKSRRDRWPAFPHSHVDGVGNYKSWWNFTTYADTGNIRAKWLDLEEAIVDTMGLRLATGYEKTIGFPGDAVQFPYLYIFAQQRYTDIRAGATDSIGKSVSLSARKAVASRPLTVVNGLGNYMTPYLYVEPVTGRTIWVHDLDAYPGSADTVWSQLAVLGGNDVTGKILKQNAAWAKTLVWDQDVYWHPNNNLEGPDLFMATLSRRWTYIWGRIKNISTMEPSYRPLVPRRGGTARS